MTQKQHFTLRANPDTIRRLVRLAERSGQTKTSLAERLLEEGVRMAEHPGIIFRDGPAGRRPGVSGLGLDVWEIIETVHNEGGDAQAAANYLAIPLRFVMVALDYYGAYPDEIDAWIERNAAMAEEAEAEFRRREAVLRR